MKKIFFKLLFLFSFFLTSCGLVKHIEVPIQTVDKIIYKDSVIFIHDSIKVEVPYEKVKEVIAVMDTSYLKTSVAESIAYVDTAKRQLFHTLTQKGQLTGKLDTIVKVQYVDRVFEREVPIEVEVVKYKRDALFWVLAAWTAICLFMVLIKMFVLK